MERIKSLLFVPSAAIGLKQKQMRFFRPVDCPPKVGDLVYGTVTYMGAHSTLENKQGRIHVINDGSKGAFVFGTRYAPDAYEGFVPETCPTEVDMLARSGIVGRVIRKNANYKDPTRIRVHGYVCDKEGTILNTRAFPLLSPPKKTEMTPRRAKLILVVGTAMNSGKSLTAAAICWALAAMGHKVRGCKVTGTASLKDILHMEDAGACTIADFSYFGYPSTYMLEKDELFAIFRNLDLKYANNPSNYWVVELADGILQRETAMLLSMDEVRSRNTPVGLCRRRRTGRSGRASRAA